MLQRSIETMLVILTGHLQPPLVTEPSVTHCAAMSGAGRLLPLQPPQVLDDLRRLLFRPEGVCFVGVPGGQQSGGRTGWFPTFPVFESLKVEVDVGLLALVHRPECSRAGVMRAAEAGDEWPPSPLSLGWDASTVLRLGGQHHPPVDGTGCLV